MSARFIFVVDDDQIYQFTANKVITSISPDHRVMIFNDGKEVYDYLMGHISEEQNIPDIILLDINMPEMDGWSFLDAIVPKLANLQKQVAVYIVSSSIDHRDIAKSKTYSVVKDYLVKPLKKEVYLRLLQE